MSDAHFSLPTLFPLLCPFFVPLYTIKDPLVIHQENHIPSVSLMDPREKKSSALSLRCSTSRYFQYALVLWRPQVNLYMDKYLSSLLETKKIYYAPNVLMLTSYFMKKFYFSRINFILLLYSHFSNRIKELPSICNIWKFVLRPC